MPHLKERFCLVPFCDLTDCQDTIHHAMGSPFFDSQGQPNYPDPIVSIVRADIADKNLPRCSMLGVSCNTRPYQSYGPVIKKIYEVSKPHKYPEVRKGMEGVMEVADVREIPPGGLVEQTDKIVLGCVAPMTGKTTPEILQNVIKLFSQSLHKLPTGSSFRMPLIGTGAALTQEATEDTYHNAVNTTVSIFLDSLLTTSDYNSMRRLILVHPFEYESQIIANTLAEKGVFLSILDKLGVATTDKRLVYGIGHYENEENKIVEQDKFYIALNHFDIALDLLLSGKRKQGLQEAAKGAEIEPALGGVFFYIRSLAIRRKGLVDAIVREALSLAKSGRIKDAYCTAHATTHLKGHKKDLIRSLRDCYIAYGIAATEARLLYEQYMETEDALQAIYNGADIVETSLSAPNTNEYKVPQGLLENLEPLRKVEHKITTRIAENCFHIIIRKFLADEMEVSGARRAFDTLLDLDRHKTIQLTDKHREICTKVEGFFRFVTDNKEDMPAKTLRKKLIDQLLEIFPEHGTLRLEIARYYLSGSEKNKQNITRAEILEAWSNLEIGQKNRSRDYGILCYIGFVILTQGGKFLIRAEDFFTLSVHLLDDELNSGRFAMRKLKSFHGTITVPHRDEKSQLAYDYYKKFRDNAQLFAKLAKALYDSESTAALSLYRQAIQSLAELGRYDLAKLYEETLGETWVVLLCRRGKTLGSIPIPFFGELSLDFIAVIYKKIRYWWRYRLLKAPEAQDAIHSFIEDMGKRIKQG